MPKITSFDKPTARKMADDLANVLVEFEREWGVKVTVGNGVFDAGKFTVKVIMETTTDEGKPTYARERLDFVRYSGIEDYKPEWLDQTVTHAGRAYKIIGYNTKKRTKPIMLESAGKVFFGSVSMVRQLMDRKSGNVGIKA